MHKQKYKQMYLMQSNSLSMNFSRKVKKRSPKQSTIKDQDVFANTKKACHGKSIINYAECFRIELFELPETLTKLGWVWKNL